MKKLLFALGIISTITTISAETIFCPSQIACIDNGNGALCQVYKGDNRWFQDVWSKPIANIRLLKTNTPFYFRFSSAISNAIISPGTGCNYFVSDSKFIDFTTKLPIVADTNISQNGWSTWPVKASKVCSGSAEQCPYVQVTFVKK